ncbi:hypothetical protein T459_16109 [Capsicum annuum]|uniref:Retrotransposon gag domain-containing protein n=1 Tax=Capsicum annuum TaxID=4072 RepID=A0A2G2Z7S5_CAPAN|nr:hypothetical protein T459_16109 [Capsicum annuum]
MNLVDSKVGLPYFIDLGVNLADLGMHFVDLRMCFEDLGMDSKMGSVGLWMDFVDGIYLPFGFKMSKFEKYEGHGDPVAYLTYYYYQLRGAGGNEELIMAYFAESFSELIPDEKSLTNMKKKRTESFTEYAIQWREQAARVKPPMKESKIVEVFIQAQDETYYQHLLPTLGKPFIEVLKMGEMIEDGIKTGRIMSFVTLKATTQAI